jgi:hypothetical protein
MDPFSNATAATHAPLFRLRCGLLAEHTFHYYLNTLDSYPDKVRSGPLTPWFVSLHMASATSIVTKWVRLRWRRLVGVVSLKV